MTDDRRRVAGSAPPPAEPDPGDTLPFAATVGLPEARPPQAQGSAAPEKSAVPEGSRPPQDLPFAATMTPQLAGPTVDMLPSRQGSSQRGSRQRGPSQRGSRSVEAALDRTHALSEGERAEAISLEPGQMIGHFVIRKRLGEGGMGVVLAGHDADLGRPVAIKLVKAEVDRPAYRARLLREAQAMARLEHRNVVRVYEVGSDRGRLFVAMELVDGVTLTAWLANRRRPWREIVAMFAQIGAGLAAAHRAGLVHRDFKPDNVLVDRDGRACVADFGLARIDPDQAAPGAGAPALAMSLTRSGMMMGTPGYMAPEQQAGAAVDARADQYSYCVALREALLGGRVVKLDRETWRHVPPALRAVVERGLAFEPRERFASMDELLEALGRVERRGATAVSVAVAGLAIAGGIATTLLVMSARDRGAGRGEAPAPTAGAGSGAAPAGAAPVAAAPAATAAAAAVEAAPPASPSLPPGAPSAAAPPPPVAPSPLLPAPRAPGAAPSPSDRIAVVSATVQGLGYDGFEPALTAAVVEQLSGMEQVIGKVKLGMVERRAGRCASAVPLWTEARQVIPSASSAAAKWHARAAIGQSLCALVAGRADEANQLAVSAWIEGNQDEIRLIMGLVQYEKGELAIARGLLAYSSQSTSPAVRAAAQIWSDRTKVTLP